MKIPGYCTKCHRVRQVNVSGRNLAALATRPGAVATGECDECETAAQVKRRARE